MKYERWVKELKANLKGVDKEERRRVLDYYAEARADRLAAGFTEEEILKSFGSPRDAARAVSGSAELDGSLYENTQTYAQDNEKRTGALARVLLIAALALPVCLIAILLGAATIIFALAPFGIAGTGVSFMINAVGCFFWADTAVGVFRLGLAILLVGAAMATENFWFWLVRAATGAMKSFFKKIAGVLE